MRKEVTVVCFEVLSHRRPEETKEDYKILSGYIHCSGQHSDVAPVK
jgi:hypothetical protein